MGATYSSEWKSISEKSHESWPNDNDFNNNSNIAAAGGGGDAGPGVRKITLCMRAFGK